MNNLFSEIFGCYYKVIMQIVNNSPLSIEEIKNIINRNGFTESCFHLLPKIEMLPFIEKKDDKYYSLLENKIKLPITNIEKSWIKSITQDKRFSLFEENYDKSKLEKIIPLYEQSQFKYYDKYLDGDNYSDNLYQKNFQKINTALENKSVVKIIYKNPKKNKITIGSYIPLKLEFSPKDDKFRFFVAKIRNNKIENYIFLNMNRIIEVRNSNEIINEIIDIEKQIKKFEAQEPIIVEIYNERNAIERFMIEFSTYKKNSEFDDKTKNCKSKIYYKKMDETEILIKLLSFGPTIKVIGSEHFLKLFKYRIKKQYKMIRNIDFNYSDNCL